MTEQKNVQGLLKLKTFFAGERQAIETLTAPDDFAAQVQKLAADYALRQQATTPPPLAEQDIRIAPPMPIPPPAQHQLKQRFRRRKSKLSPAMTAAVAMAALIICAIALTLPSDTGLPAGFAGLVEIKAAYAATNGIDVHEGFIISASEPLPAELVEKALNVYPAFDYQLEQQDDTTYHVLPTEPLTQNTVYHLSFDPERAQEDKPERAEYSWSFQTEADLQLLECSPTDTARDVPLEASVTLIFNKEIAAQAGDFISIEPQVEGEWLVEGANLHFTPAGGWADDTVYTLALLAGLPAVDETALQQGRVSRFHTERVERFEFSLAARETYGKTFTNQENPSFLLDEQLESDGSPYVAVLHMLPDSYTYASALSAQDSGLGNIDTTEWELLAEYELLPIQEEQGYTLALPESLPPGFYILDLSKQGHENQLLFQVSSLNAYVALGENDTLFWLHDATGNPVYDALVTLWPQGMEGGLSDMQGVALLPASQQDSSLLLYCIDAEQESLVLRLDNGARPSQILPQPVWALYTAQSRYQAGDTVDFFGVYEPNETDATPDSQQLTLRLKAMGANMVVLPYAVQVDGSAFSGSLPLPGLRPGWYELALYDDDIYVGGSFIQVVESSKPLWQVLQEAIMQPEQAAEEQAEQPEQLAEQTELPEQLEQPAEQAEQPLEEAWTIDQPLLLQDAYAANSLDAHAYAEGEEVELGLYYGRESLPLSGSGSSLFVLAGESILAHQVAETTAAFMPVPAAYPAAFWAWGVYYYEGRYYESTTLLLAGEQPQAALLQAEWQPADEADDGSVLVSLSLSDSGGAPLSATLNLNLLTQEPAQKDNFFANMDDTRPCPAYQRYSSMDNNAAARMMPNANLEPLPGEEEQPPQEDKAASALFTTLTTDEWGNAELVFTPPVQGREWFLSWRAYDGQQPAAAGMELLDLRLPLSVDYILGQEFLPGDMPELRFRTTGTALAEDDSISYELRLPELDFRYSGNAAAEEWCAVTLPQLTEGSYELSLQVSGGGKRQEYNLPLNVQQHSNAFFTLHQQALQATTRLDIDSDDDVTVIFSSPTHADAIADLFVLAQQDAVRLDYKLAAYAAANLLRQYGVDIAENFVDDLPLYQRENGGLAPFTGSAASSKLSALAAPLITRHIDSAALAAYLRAYYEQAQEPQEQALALYGLASLKQPVLLDIDSLAAEETNADTRLYLALAYMACGNGAAAKALAVDLLAVLLPAEEGGLQPTERFTDRQEAEAYLALLAQIFALPQAGELYANVLADDTPRYGQTLALAQILAVQSLALPQEAGFNYQLGGISRQVQLSRNSHFSLTLPGRQLAGLIFNRVDGQVDLSVIMRQQGWQEAQQLTQQQPSIERSFMQLQTDEYALTQVQLDIYLPEDAEPGYYRVEDALPAGLRFHALDTEASSRLVRLFAQDSAKVSFDIYKGEGAYEGSVVYTARVHTTGLYMAAQPRLYAIRQQQLNAVGTAQQVEVK